MFVTFSLFGCVPVGRRFSGNRFSSGREFLDRLLDRAVAGPLYLGRPEVAEIVAGAIVAGAARDYVLHCWVVMGNHVHLRITPHGNVSDCLRILKGLRRGLRILLIGRRGAFWQNESYDHVVRDAAEFGRIESYILMNPVRAGMAERPEQYRWSSAFAGTA